MCVWVDAQFCNPTQWVLQVFAVCAGDNAAPADVPPPITKPAARINIKIASAARTIKLIGNPCAFMIN
jgi:hypothetical protein